jgi:hypothetical protein
VGVLAVTALGLVACKSDTGPSNTVACIAGDPVCPPAGLAAGFTGATGTPIITPSNVSLSISTPTSAFVVFGTTNSATNGHWLLVTGNTLRAWGVIAVSGPAFAAEIPLFCGQQQIMYTFNNGSGRSYWTTAVTLTGCTTPAFRAQLTWDTGPTSDMDLHLIRPAGAPNTTNDCYFADCQGVPLEWGAAGAAGNPVLDVDDVEGYGPENIVIGSGAEAGTYKVYVYNYDGTPSTRATVKLFFNDVEVNRWTSQTLDTGVRDWWLVASVNIQNQTVTPLLTYSTTTPALLGAAAAVAPRK